MANEIRLPDIGDFKDVPIIEILIAPGQSVQKDAPILTLESDKATMDVPAPEDGVIGEVHVKVGDKVSQGALLATYAGGARREAGSGSVACRCGARGRARNSCSRRLRDRHTGSRRRSGRLYRRFPRRRSRAERRAGRRAADPRRRMPQCRLHPVQGAAACRQDHRRGGGVRQPTA